MSDAKRVHLHLDMSSGVAGDMLLGALLHSGVPREVVDRALFTIGFEKEAFVLEEVVRGGVRSFSLRITDYAEEVGLACKTYKSGQEILEASILKKSIKERAVRVFRSLAEAEASVHGVSIQKIHFHEVGAADTLIDIVGVMAALDWLAPVSVTASPVSVGGGTVKTLHGVLPVPAPATAELLRGIPICGEPGPRVELATPTGAALVKEAVTYFGNFPSLRVEGIGYGAGDKELEDRPNVLRALWGEADTKGLFQGGETEKLVEIRANIDDSSPEILGNLSGQLLEMGALDVWLTPVIMKKGRPAVVLNVLVSSGAEEPFVEKVFRETTSFGVRWSPAVRNKLFRERAEVETEWGKVKVVVGRRGDEVITISPEFESCRQVADNNEVAVKAVFEAAMAAWYSKQ